ncbi:minor capsid protein [Crassaminicella profunda]|uniref:minor capsid protein n=1 Tax=Crassaminicella profunda TaxID=1286698 RepID=UPI001CA63816|nr:minor capsid protein [Crassaminicella profunda]QZY56700.1 minor capsid protein [Crassaminicella profunda]
MGLISWFKKKSSGRGQGGYTTQTRETNHHPFSMLDKYIPRKYEYELYKTMREAVPILDTAIYRIVRLIGTFDIECDNDKGKKEIQEFLNNIKVNSKQKGIKAFIQSYIDQLIECGNSAGEIVLNNAKNDVYALKSVDIRSIKLKRTENTLENVVCQMQQGHMDPVELPYQDLILFTPLNPEGDNPYGISLFRSMPFMTGILLRIFNSIGINWERFGNVRYNVTYKPQKDIMDGTKVKARMKIIEEEFNKAMKESKRGKVSDFIGVGDIEIKVIGADNQILDSKVPVTQVLEQLVAKTGLPPFLLGLSWSTTERMSQQQADFLTSELESYRDVITPVIRYIIDMWQIVTGRNIPYEVVWDDINLQDLVEIAKAELYKQQSEGKKIDNVIRKRDQNIIDQETATKELGYDAPIGEAPEIISPTEEQKAFDKTKRVQLLKSPFDSPPEDEQQNQIEQDTLKGYMKCVQRLENKVIALVQEPTNEKSFSREKELAPDHKEKVEKAIDDFVKDMLGQGVGSDYGTYGTYLLNAFGYGLVRGNKTAKEEHGDRASDNNKESARYDHPYVQELLNNGMDRVKTKAKEKQDDILLIMAEHAEVGDNPVEWARQLRKELKDTISGEKWYWERLARSESAMAIDRAEMAEYEAEGFGYCEWSAAPDACHICQSFHGQMWSIADAPEVVVDTHPHCRCRKLPRTKRQYDEYMTA